MQSGIREIDDLLFKNNMLNSETRTLNWIKDVNRNIVEFKLSKKEFKRVKIKIGDLLEINHPDMFESVIQFADNYSRKVICNKRFRIVKISWRPFTWKIKVENEPYYE